MLHVGTVLARMCSLIAHNTLWQLKRPVSYLCILLIDPDLFVGYHLHHMALLPHHLRLVGFSRAIQQLHGETAAPAVAGPEEQAAAPLAAQAREQKWTLHVCESCTYYQL